MPPWSQRLLATHREQACKALLRHAADRTLRELLAEAFDAGLAAASTVPPPAAADEAATGPTSEPEPQRMHLVGLPLREQALLVAAADGAWCVIKNYPSARRRAELAARRPLRLPRRHRRRQPHRPGATGRVRRPAAASYCLTRTCAERVLVARPTPMSQPPGTLILPLQTYGEPP